MLAAALLGASIGLAFVSGAVRYGYRVGWDHAERKAEKQRGFEVTVNAFDLTLEEQDALFDRVSDAAHALDQQVTCSCSQVTP